MVLSRSALRMSFFKWQVEHLLMLTQIPDVCLVACQSGAVDSGLLTCADTDGLTVFDVADRVGLGVFECNQADEQVDLCIFRQLFVLGNDILEQVGVNLQIVSTLFKGDTKHILVLDWLRNISRVDLDDVVGAFAFFFQDFQSLFGVARSDDTIRNLALDDSCGAGITNVRQSDKVAVGGHSVCASCSCISAGDWGKLSRSSTK